MIKFAFSEAEQSDYFENVKTGQADWWRGATHLARNGARAHLGRGGKFTNQLLPLASFPHVRQGCASSEKDIMGEKETKE